MNQRYTTRSPRSKHSILLTVGILSCIFSFSQLPNFKQYSIENGLNCSTIYTCIQDRNGFMWFASENGVTRFDGHFFDTFTIEDGLSDNEVFNLFEDSKGRIWFLTYNGRLSYFENGTIINEKTDSTLAGCYAGSGFHSMFEDYFGNLWISALNGSLVIKSATEVNIISFPTSVLEFPVEGCKKGIIAFPIHSATDSTLYVFFKAAVYRYDYEKKQLFKHIEPFPTCINHFFRVSAYEAFSSSTFNSIIGIKGSDSENMPLTFDSEIMALTKYDEHMIVACSDKKTILVSNQGKERSCILNDIQVNKIYVDRQKNIWLCTRNEGVLQINQRMLSSSVWNKKSGLSSGNIQAILVKNNQWIWLGLENGEVATIINDQITNIPFVTGSSVNSRALSLVETPDGSLFIGSDIGIDKIGPDGKLRKFRDGKNHLIGAVKNLSLSFDKQSIYASSSSGIFKLYTQNEDQDITQVRLSVERSFVAHIDRQGNIWHATINGLYCSSPEKIDMTKDPLVCTTRIFKIIQKDDSTFFAASESLGIFIIQNKKIVDTIRVSNNGITARCHDVCFASDQLFIGTNNGLYFFHLVNGKWITKGQMFTRDGLPSPEVNAIAYFDGKVYVGTSKGLAILPVIYESIPDQPFCVYLRKISGSWGSAKDLQNVTLNYLHNNLNIEYSAITLVDNELVSFFYSLNDTSGWHSIEGHDLALSELPYGMNKIFIRAVDNNGQASSPVVLCVNITAPFWRSMWFRIGLLFHILLLLMAFYYLWSKQRINKLKQDFILNAERSRISADLHDDIGADLTRINLMASLLQHSKDETLKANTTNKIIAESSELRNKADQIIWALTPENDSTENLLAYLNHLGRQIFQDGTIRFHFENQLSNNIKLHALKRRNIFLIVKEALNNVQKHSGATDVRMTAAITNSVLIIQINDNGNGLTTDSENAFGRSGIKNMRKRAFELGGKILFTTSIPSGMTVEIIIPLHQ